jgi:hypothetical protein
MNEYDRLDERWLHSLDDLQLEGLRLDLLRVGDRRAEHVMEYLLARAIAHIDRVVAQLGGLRGLDSDGLAAATVDASVRLQLRLTREEPLPSIETLAGIFARESVEAIEPQPPTPPRLAARPPRLRTVDDALGDALADGRVKPNTWRDS